VVNDPLEDASTTDLVKEVFDDARQLVKLELALARRELQGELAQARTAAIALAVAVLASNVGIAMLLIAIALATAAPVAVSAIIGVFLLVGAAIAARVARSALPKTLLPGTVRRIADDVRGLEGVTHGA
jgi:hypothetical protein